MDLRGLSGGSGPGFLILLERIDVHPAFEYGDGVDLVSLINQFLEEILKEVLLTPLDS